ncbi:MAG: CoA transferase, partial [Dehalococcoidia bacterium]
MDEHATRDEDAPHGPLAHGPLEGVRVLDLAGESGLFAGRQLGELGADVVRVEPPGGGSERRRQPFLRDASGPAAASEASLYHLHFNANKRGIALDPASEEDRGALRSLLERADLLLRTSDGVDLDAYGIEAGWPAAANPALVSVDLAAFHRDGPFADYRANDLVAVASSGLMYLNGFPEDPPVRPGAEQGYHMGALVAAAGALVALVGRERDPERRGRRVDVSMQEAASMATLQTANANILTWHGRVPARVGNRPDGQPGSIYQCGDGRWISFVVPLGAPALWRAYVEWMAEEGFADEYADPRWNDPAYRQAHWLVTRGVLEALCAKYDRAHVFHEGQRRRMLVMPLNDARDLLEDEHFRDRGFYREFDHEPLG